MYRDREKTLRDQAKAARARIQGLETNIFELRQQQLALRQSQAEELQSAQDHAAELAAKVDQLKADQKSDDKFILQTEISQYTKTFEEDCRTFYTEQIDGLQHQLVCGRYSWSNIVIMNCVSEPQGERASTNCSTS